MDENNLMLSLFGILDDLHNTYPKMQPIRVCQTLIDLVDNACDEWLEEKEAEC
jgi:hypothetical protein